MKKLGKYDFMAINQTMSHGTKIETVPLLGLVELQYHLSPSAIAKIK